MPRALLRLGVVVWAAAGVALGVAPSVARADAPQQQGWWTVANPGGLPANPASAAADVPPDGLLVQAGPVNPTSPCGCTAYAAVVYELSNGTTASDLTLKAAPNSATTPVATLQLCALVNPTLDAEQGGPLGDGPDYDCKSHATASLANGSFKFSVGSLVSKDGILAVAILPGDSTSRVVLSRPDSSSLAGTPSTSSSSSFNPATPAAVGGASTSSGGGATTGADSVPSLSAPPPATAPDSGQTPVVAPAASPSAATTSVATTPLAATSDAGSGSSPVGVGLLVAGVAVGAALWALAGRAPLGDAADT